MSTNDVLGRESELAQLDGFTGLATPQTALALTGEPGIGKSTLWEAGLAMASRRGMQALRARPAAAEVDFSFAGLADLFEASDAAVFAALPPPQRRALEIALLRAEPGDAPPAR